MFVDLLLSRGDVKTVDGTFKERQRGYRLVEGHLMTGLVDTGKGEQPALPYLAVLLVVGRVQGGIAGFLVAVMGNLFGNDLTAKPVAVELSSFEYDQSANAAYFPRLLQSNSHPHHLPTA